jgi:hypothetical protein
MLFTLGDIGKRWLQHAAIRPYNSLLSLDDAELGKPHIETLAAWGGAGMMTTGMSGGLSSMNVFIDRGPAALCSN